MKNIKRVLLNLGVATLIFTATPRVCYAVMPSHRVISDVPVETEESITGYEINGVKMSEVEYQDFMNKMSACKSKEEYYNLYNSYGMDTSELDKVYKAQENGTKYDALKNNPNARKAEDPEGEDDFDPIDDEEIDSSNTKVENLSEGKQEISAKGKVDGEQSEEKSQVQKEEAGANDSDVDVAEGDNQEIFKFDSIESEDDNLLAIMASLLGVAALVVLGCAVMILKKKK